MRNLAVALLFALPVALFGWACSLIVFAPPEPPFDWMSQMSVVDHDALVALIDHQYTVAAYAVTWAIQLGYLVCLGLKWRAQKREAARPVRSPR